MASESALKQRTLVYYTTVHSPEWVDGNYNSIVLGLIGTGTGWESLHVGRLNTMVDVRGRCVPMSRRASRVSEKRARRQWPA
jgi:hypothetical protein